MLFAAVSAFTLLSAASAQMTVQVGSTATAQGGVFQFIPNNFNATKGTTITFQFTGAPGNHTVTQSTFTDPCDPTPGGFDSGWVFVPTSPALAETPEFNLTITDDTKPIWFFCKQLIPSPHCGAGMVGAINAPATGNTFTSFQTNAKNFGKASGQGQGALVGIGASASAPLDPFPAEPLHTLVSLSLQHPGRALPLVLALHLPPALDPPAASQTAASGATSVVVSSFVAVFAAAVGFILV
ncbi:hypothetical protein CPB84DRAFT_1915464 [Gymnopilus junonius]|uniref:Blue (type 1) copper domain-containing protein n=1 Tax=Gymnopilus junonius TaxID=109634 RepID=A0A9P5NLI0_GYMJU|nr:hypothetical protein CPB84DRAFT_1915464 [Gymnopilus junonius]